MEVWIFEQLPLIDMQLISGIDVNVRTEHVFFSDVALKKIFGTTINGTGVIEVLSAAILLRLRIICLYIVVFELFYIYIYYTSYEQVKC